MNVLKNRVYELDILRVLACLMVICMHAPYPKEGANGLFLSTLSYFTAPCIGLFFMVSGALLSNYCFYSLFSSGTWSVVVYVYLDRIIPSCSCYEPLVRESQ